MGYTNEAAYHFDDILYEAGWIPFRFTIMTVSYLIIGQFACISPSNSQNTEQIRNIWQHGKFYRTGVKIRNGSIKYRTNGQFEYNTPAPH